MKIDGARALVTGANRGIGRAFVNALLERGAELVHVVGRDLESLETMSGLDRDRIRPVELDVTDAVGIEELAASMHDLNLLINNAGVECNVPVLATDAMADLRRVMEVNYFGVLNMSRAFAPVLAKARESVLVNIGSMAAFINVAQSTGYSAAKAAQLMLTLGLRAELAGQGTRVVQVLPGFVDTDMSRSFPVPKVPPEEIARATLDAVEAGEELVLPDRFARLSYEAMLAEPDRIMREPARVLEELVGRLLEDG